MKMKMRKWIAVLAAGMIGLLPTMGLAETAEKVDINNDTRTIYFLDGTSKNLGEVIESLNILFSNNTYSTIRRRHLSAGAGGVYLYGKILSVFT